MEEPGENERWGAIVPVEEIIRSDGAIGIVARTTASDPETHKIVEEVLTTIVGDAGGEVSRHKPNAGVGFLSLSDLPDDRVPGFLRKGSAWKSLARRNQAAMN
jgi:hypothetical protein